MHKQRRKNNKRAAEQAQKKKGECMTSPIPNLENMNIKQLQEELQKQHPEHKKLSDDDFKKLLATLSASGLSPKKALKIDDETVEAFYTHAYNLYNQGKYLEASYIFRFLMLLDMSSPKYILGTAACLHRMKNYSEAAYLYFICGAVDMRNPMPHYHATDCYLNLNQPQMALVSIQLCLNAAQDQPQYAIIKERAELLKASLHKQLTQELMKSKSEEKAK